MSLVACEQNMKTNNNMDSESVPQHEDIKQNKSQLLAGVSKAISYSGFRTGQHPDRGDGAINPSREEILEDLTILQDAGFKLIRLYDSGENSETVLSLIKENNLDIKVMLGAWLQAELSNHESCAWLKEPIPQDELELNKFLNTDELKKCIVLANKYPEIIVAVNVGNEALVDWNDHKVDTDSIIAYVKRVKKEIKQLVTVAENYEWWHAKGKELAAEVDFLAIHIYPIWEGKDIDQGMSYSLENIQRVVDSLPNTTIVISEAGWASIGSELGDRASEEKQKQYYDELMSWCDKMNITCFFFEAFDEDWKGNPSNMMGAEKHWGLFTVDRIPKEVMKNLYPVLN